MTLQAYPSQTELAGTPQAGDRLCEGRRKQRFKMPHLLWGHMSALQTHSTELECLCNCKTVPEVRGQVI